MNNVIKGNLRSKTTWFGSALVVAGAILEAAPGFVEQYLPVLLAVVPPEYGKTLSAIGAVVVALRNVTNKPVAEKVSKEGGFARPLMLAFLLAIAIASTAVLSGCATNGGLTDGGKAALREVAAIAVSRYARENVSPEQIARVRRALEDLQNTPDITTVAALKAAVQARIESNVGDPYDRQDLTRLLNIVAPLLADYVGSGDLAPDAVVKVRDFLSYLAAALPPAA